jgi:ABC-2 type transport system permease protein
LKKYFSLIFYSFLQNGKNRREIAVRSSFFIVILYIFSKLWGATQFSHADMQHMMLWYLSITEVIILSVPLIQVDIENEIRNGDVVYHLLKPINYLWLKISDCIGAFLFRFMALSLIAIPFCAYMSGILPPLFNLLITYLAALIAGVVFIFFHACIGLLAFKLEDSSPIFWIWQRSSFLFGGLILPLTYYPSYLKTASYFLPFASLLYGPARLILECNGPSVISAIVGLVFWAIVGLLLSHWLFSRMVRALKINGG